MGIRYRIDSELALVVTTASGLLEDADLLDYGRRLLADPDRSKAKHELVDLRRVDDASSVSSEGIRALAEFWTDRSDQMAGGRLAIVARSNVGYGMSRMYQILRSDGPDSIQVFRDLERALTWLEVDETLAHRLELPK
ncbi:MAG: hypothetical protein ACQGVK_25945 [Myxococcota bacterium]